MSVKNPMTPAGIEPATFRFVAQLSRSPRNTTNTSNKMRFVCDYIILESYVSYVDVTVTTGLFCWKMYHRSSKVLTTYIY